MDWFERFQTSKRITMYSYFYDRPGGFTLGKACTVVYQRFWVAICAIALVHKANIPDMASSDVAWGRLSWSQVSPPMLAYFSDPKGCEPRTFLQFSGCRSRRTSDRGGT